MMKVIIMQHNLNEKGGAERVILKIAKHYDAKIYTLGYDKHATFEEFEDLDVHVFAKKSGLYNILPKRVGNALHYAFNFYNLKIKEDYDFINPHMSPTDWIRNRNKRVLWYCHTPPREVYDLKNTSVRQWSLKEKIMYKTLAAIYKKVENNIVDKLEGIAVNSENTNSRLKEYFGRRGIVINPGIDAKLFKDSGDEKFFLYPSRISQQKRQDYVIRAFSRLTKNKKYSDYKLVLAGSLSSRYTDFSSYLQKLKDMNVKNVIFKENPTDIELRNLYSKSTAVLFSAVNEDYGIVPLEGMASKKVVISVNEGGPKETIVNKSTGFLVNSEVEMAEKMKFVIEHPKLAEKMGKEGRKRVEANYSWKNFFEKFDRLGRRVSKY